MTPGKDAAHETGTTDMTRGTKVDGTAEKENVGDTGEAQATKDPEVTTIQGMIVHIMLHQQREILKTTQATPQITETAEIQRTAMCGK